MPAIPSGDIPHPPRTAPAARPTSPRTLNEASSDYTYTTSYSPTYNAGVLRRLLRRAMLYSGLLYQGVRLPLPLQHLELRGTGQLPAVRRSPIVSGFSGILGLHGPARNTGARPSSPGLPTPRSTKDWRQLYFKDSFGQYPGSPTTRRPVERRRQPDVGTQPYNSNATNYQINYKAILSWIVRQRGPTRSRRSSGPAGPAYYSYIPVGRTRPRRTTTASPTATSPTPACGSGKNTSTTPWASGETRTATSGRPAIRRVATGPDFAWGTIQITAKPSGTPPSGQNLSVHELLRQPAPAPAPDVVRPDDHAPVHLRHRPEPGGPFATSRRIRPSWGSASILSRHPASTTPTTWWRWSSTTGPSTPTSRPSASSAWPFTGPEQRNYTAMTSSLWYPPNSSARPTSPPGTPTATQTPSADNDFIYTTPRPSTA